MPLILEPKTWEAWLRGDLDAAASLMKPANEDVLVGRPVSKAVGNVKNNGPELLIEDAMSAINAASPDPR
jgi:putative SOS response-associated peptidase YedK